MTVVTHGIHRLKSLLYLLCSCPTTKVRGFLLRPDGGTNRKKWSRVIKETKHTSAEQSLQEKERFEETSEERTSFWHAGLISKRTSLILSWILQFILFSCPPLDTDLVSSVGLWKLPEVRLLTQIVKVAVGQLSALGGNFHSETGGNAICSLTVHQSKSLKVSWKEGWGHL